MCAPGWDLYLTGASAPGAVLAGDLSGGGSSLQPAFRHTSPPPVLLVLQLQEPPPGSVQLRARGRGARLQRRRDHQALLRPGCPRNLQGTVGLPLIPDPGDQLTNCGIGLKNNLSSFGPETLTSLPTRPTHPCPRCSPDSEPQPRTLSSTPIHIRPRTPLPTHSRPLRKPSTGGGGQQCFHPKVRVQLMAEILNQLLQS